ncbi:efflux RND transporter periplasmic adaptor subunit [uncultured Paraglaciecola sp.]|uniref:efflux RND transporter periplasmic adaptor subunit n=1 Tax=uncultured Paraglaciecola sp. TaxID=1765024 RepID=UPI0026170BE0|nr:efflux RND transporter periplasmic adaptor subunit [uncultured Paraglaciecola sp.]
MRSTSGQDKAIERPNTVYKKPIISIIILAIVISTLIYVWPSLSRLFSADQTISQSQLRFAKVQKGDLQRDISVQGRVIAANSPTLFAPSAGIVSLQIKAGDKVSVGQKLASIFSPELTNRLSQEEATYDQLAIEVGRHKIQIKSSLLNNQQAIELASVNLEVSKVEKNRAETSIQNSLISQRELEEKVAAFKRANLSYRHALQNHQLQKESMEFDLKSKQSQLERQEFVVTDLRRQVSNLSITSPIAGIIGSVNIREKDTVTDNTPLLTIIDLSIFEVEVNIPENFADDLGIGLATEISFNGQTHLGEVTAISPEVSEGQVVGRIRFSQSNLAGLRQNQRVTARVLIESKENVLKVKRGAFVESGGGRIAYVVDNQTATRRSIQLGARSLGEVEVLSGLEQGDEIIISSLSQFNKSELISITK